MHFSRVLAVSASFIALGLAADPLAFTSWPQDVAAGKPVTLTWAGAVPGQPVTLTLRKGTSTHLKDVETITSEAKDGTFTWTPGDNVKEGETYAFQVSQGGQVNYSALLKAGAGAPKAETTGATHTNAATTEATAATAATGTTTGTNIQTTMGTETQTTSKPLISSSASGSPSGSPSSATVSSTMTNGPMMTETGVMNGKEASETGTTQSGMASVPSLSREIVLGALGLFVYLVQ
ncbi:hypothetical protein N7509_004088 [Penicillium cosmopolitanum]|uniref:Yeast cell wall synthesis Kre9/Knh1-like N-terminal domain-containing protein n=1 Tax=Penicillium cosmopolitanum TaxID=1131564 RepID=A0A9X0BC42_9EURO|nr:uncharacterized protein N7509_004088 [Penicillium cosmopolitanum]KAJ5404217.1 hypothetical protein N7509_004088 [Penicillium cosmopolitanum]